MSDTLLKQMPVLAGFDPDDYQSAREWAEAPDGTKVPVDVVWRRDTPLDGTAALSLYAYGAYEYSRPPWFSIDRLSLLDRGGVWALAHPRGGGELGRAWYLDGKLLAKRNTFTDFIACAEHLVAQGYGAPDRVTIRGGSAGGLLVGACLTQRPDLYAGVVAAVPFVDVVTTMRDPSIPLTIGEWEEWGDPRVEPYASYMLGYSPYDNVEPGAVLPGAVRHGRPQRSPGHVPRAGQVGRQAPGAGHHAWAAAAAHRAGRRPQRPVRSVRDLAGRSPHAGLPAGRLRHHPLIRNSRRPEVGAERAVGGAIGSDFARPAKLS